MLKETIEKLDVMTLRIPTDQPETDGTAEWDHTDMVVVQVHCGKMSGIGWSYASEAAAQMIETILRDRVEGQSALAVEAIWQRMNRSLRNAGVPGVGLMAISAVDVALWDLKAKLLDLALVDLFGSVREAVDLYGSGGFTNYSDERLAEQLGAWAAQGIAFVKMKVGRDPAADLRRAALARNAIGPKVQLFVDANGGYSTKQALAMAEKFAHEFDVRWFEEPRPSDDLKGLRLLRNRSPAGMDIAAGEYGDTTGYFRRMLEAGAVDCLQADVTRCGGYTGFLKVGALCEAFAMPLSAHCAPQLHAHVGCAVQSLRHVEYFHDQVRIADLLLDGALAPENGKLRPDRARAGHGLALKTADADRYRV